MFIILDTTEFFDAPKADSGAFTLLAEYLKKTPSQLLIPEVVIQETSSHAAIAASDITGNLKSAQRKHDKFRIPGGSRFVAPAFDEATLSLEYSDYLNERLKTAFGATILPIANVDQAVIFDRSLKRMKPFIKGKDGYRDTLIWLTILRRLKEVPGEYVFITSNSKDFSHAELLEEADAALESGTFKIVNSLDDYIAEFAKPSLTSLNDMHLQLSKSLAIGDFSLQQELENLSTDMLGAISDKLSFDDPSLYDLEKPFYISLFSSPSGITIEEVYQADTAVVVLCTADYECQIEAYVNKWDAFDNENFTVTDFEWNEHYAEVELTRTLQVSFIVTLKTDYPADGDGPAIYSAEALEVSAVKDIS